MTTSVKLEALALDVERKAGALESILLSFVGRVASWVGPVPIAVFTASELDDVFGASQLLAIASAASLELIGVNLANRWMKFKMAGDEEEPLALRLMWGFYVMDFAITSLIVARRIIDGGSFTYLIAALFPVAAALSIVSLNQSIQAQRRKAEKAESARLRKVEREAKKALQDETLQSNNEVAPEVTAQESQVTDFTPQLDELALKVYEVYTANPDFTKTALAEAVGVSRPTVNKRLAQLEAAGKFNGNGYH